MKFRVPVEKLAYSDLMSASNSCVLPISCNFSGLGHSKQLFVEASIKIINE